MCVEALVKDLELLDLYAGGSGGGTDEDVLAVERRDSLVRRREALRARDGLQSCCRQRLVHVVLCIFFYCFSGGGHANQNYCCCNHPLY